MLVKLNEKGKLYPELVGMHDCEEPLEISVEISQKFLGEIYHMIELYHSLAYAGKTFDIPLQVYLFSHVSYYSIDNS